jgi:uncharacterized protein YjiS (DUF1127 family)
MSRPVAMMTDTALARGQMTAHLRQRLADIAEAWGRWRLYRRTLAEMSALSDRALADLGLHRSMLKRVAWIATHET